jgi:hypothetical protein
MSLKPQISTDVPAADVPKKVSGEFKGLVKIASLANQDYTVVSFPGMRGHSTSIIDSKTLTKALKKTSPTSQKIIVVAHDFTVEAREIMKTEEIMPIFERDFGWTDERWAYIRDNY